MLQYQDKQARCDLRAPLMKTLDQGAKMLGPFQSSILCVSVSVNEKPKFF